MLNVKVSPKMQSSLETLRICSIETDQLKMKCGIVAWVAQLVSCLCQD